MKNLNQKGLTLIEILAAVVILMIVIVGFLGFFSQAISHSRITEDKLTAINLAEKVLSERKNSSDKLEGREYSVEDVNGKTYYAIIDQNPSIQTNPELNLQVIYIEIYSKDPTESKNVNIEPITELYSYHKWGIEDEK